jgi:hypothetical protein
VRLAVRAAPLEDVRDVAVVEEQVLRGRGRGPGGGGGRLSFFFSVVVVVVGRRLFRVFLHFGFGVRESR